MIEVKRYKNWKEICAVMNWKTTCGNYKNARLKELESICKYHKEGNAFIIEEIYDTKKEIINNIGRSGKYTDDIQEALLYMLYHIENCNGSVNLSLNQILKSIEMVNQNYSKYRNEIEKLSNELKMKEIYIRDFYDNNHKNLRQKIETSLNNLERRKLVDWQKVLMINISEVATTINQFGKILIDENTDKPVYKINNITRVATEVERKVILDAEKSTLKELDCKNVGEIISKGLWSKYEKMVHNKLRGTGVKYYFTGYNIVFIKEYIKDEVVGDIGYKTTINNLNNNVANMVIKGAETRHKNAIEKISNYLGKLPEEDCKITQKDDYVENNKKLTNKLIVR